MRSRIDSVTHPSRVPGKRGYDSVGAPHDTRILGYLGQVEGREVVRQAVVHLTPRVEPGFGLVSSCARENCCRWEGLTLRVRSWRTLGAAG